MIVARLSKIVDADWSRVEPVPVGRALPDHGTPCRYVTVSDNDRLQLRVDVYADVPDCFAFEEALAWHGHVFVGFGSHVHAVSLRDRSAVTIALDSYFGHFYPTSDYLLVATGERLFRVEPDRSALWKSAPIAIDGVVVTNPEPPIIRGDGEWDPPGGWKPFSLRAEDGQAVI